MKYSVVYTSRTGNTKQLAEAVAKELPEPEVGYFGLPDFRGTEAEIILAGFWTDRGSCSEEFTEFLRQLHNKTLFLFGTAGFGSSKEYFSRILENVAKGLDHSNTLAGSFMCQGKMPESVRKRYEQMLPEQPEKMRELIENFDRARQHPDKDDILALKEAVCRAFSQ